MNSICYLVLFFFCSYASAKNNGQSDRSRHRQRLPININAILASSTAEEEEFLSSDEVEIAAVESDAPTYSSTSGTNSPAGVSATNSPTIADATDLPTEDIFATRAPTAKPTESPTVTSR
jgi:hypothetical protein